MATPTTTPQIASFTIGASYAWGFPGEERNMTLTCVARTAKTVTFSGDSRINGKRLKAHVYNDSEYIFPCGKYSMAPVCKAKNIKA